MDQGHRQEAIIGNESRYIEGVVNESRRVPIYLMDKSFSASLWRADSEDCAKHNEQDIVYIESVWGNMQRKQSNQQSGHAINRMVLAMCMHRLWISIIIISPTNYAQQAWHIVSRGHSGSPLFSYQRHLPSYQQL